MIPIKKETHEVTSTIDGNVIGMKIDENSVHHIMAVLTDLYSDAEMAVLREYATNAYDAHVEAGNPMPIEVFLPTPLAPFLRIKDNGVGLDAYDIENIYSKYGLSTKTHTNDQTGVLGLGCKSALTYTNQFTVVGTKDGVRTSVSVSRDEEGVGTMTIVDMVDTEDANGVEIIVPTKVNNTFAKKARRLFRFWPAGSVLLDGKEVEPIEGLEITPEIKLVRRDHRTRTHPYGDGEYYGALQSYVVMGKVPYPLDHTKISFGLPENYAIVAYVPNGAVHFTPSREALHYTKVTQLALTQLKDDFEQGLQTSIERDIEAASTRAEALQAMLRWREALPRALGNMAFKYKGMEIPAEIVAPTTGATWVLTSGKDERDYYGKRVKIGSHSTVHAIDLRSVSEAIWVYNFNRTFTATAKKKMWMWCDEQEMEYPPNFICCSNKPDSPWIPPENMVDWDVISQLKLPRTASGGRTFHTGRLAGSYDCYTCTGGEVAFEVETPADDIDTDSPIFWVSHIKGRNFAHTAKRLAMFMDDFTLVILTGNRIAKFTRTFPEAIEPHDTLRQGFEDFIGALTDQEKRAMLMQMQYGSGGDRLIDRHPWLPRVGLLDPEINAAFALIEYKPQWIQKLIKMYEAFDRPNGRYEPSPLGQVSDIISGIKHRYPLVETYAWGSSRRMTRLHNKIYMNAIYTELYKEN